MYIIRINVILVKRNVLGQAVRGQQKKHITYDIVSFHATRLELWCWGLGLAQFLDSWARLRNAWHSSIHSGFV